MPVLIKVVGIDADEVKGVTLESQSGDIVKAKWLITCTGLHADYVAHMAGGAKRPVILPFRGNYKELKPTSLNTTVTLLLTQSLYLTASFSFSLPPIAPCCFLVAV